MWKWNRGRLSGSFPEGPFVLISNHSSYFDWLLLDTLLTKLYQRDVRFVASRKVHRHPVGKLLCHHCQVIEIAENSPAKAAATMLRFLKQATPDTVLVVFPEGTRSRTGEQLPGYRGAAWAARRAGLPIVPTALCGLWELWPPQRSLPTLRRVGLSLEVFSSITLTKTCSDQELTDQAMARIYEHVLADRQLRAPASFAATPANACIPTQSRVDSAKLTRGRP